jgi:hypothetical protein
MANAILLRTFFQHFELRTPTHRMATVNKLEADCKQLGVVITPEIQQHIDAAQESMKRADAAGSDRAALVRASMESLRDSLRAAELLSLARARSIIERNTVRTGFLFGCNGFGLAEGRRAGSTAIVPENRGASRPTA